MAKNIAVTIAVIFFVFTLVNARSPLTLPENGVTVHDVVTESPVAENEAVPSILLPSQNIESESKPGKVVDFDIEKEPEAIEPKLAEIEPAETTTEEKQEAETETTTTTTVPLTVVTFRPINRHFIRGSLIPFRFGRRCGHHHHQFKRWGPRFHGQVSYGNDMILPRDKDFGSDPVNDGEDRQIPARWFRFRHEHHPKFMIMHEMEKLEEMKMPHEHERIHHHHHHHHHHNHEEEEEEEREFGHEHKHEMGFMKKIRKFLTHF